jgi:protein-L-isoaspartate(D-aspartate) O-methyltransferase
MSTIISSSRTKRRAFSLAWLFLFLATSWFRVHAAQQESTSRDGTDPFSQIRSAMVERDLRGRGIKDRRVLAAMDSLPRHLFVPENLRSVAYEDRALPIGQDQTISQPYVVAFMTELLELKGAEKVLEIGTGSGYQTAVLARLVSEVFSIEILPSLSERAKEILERIGFDNVRLKVGDGFFGWAEKAPFDAILVTAAAPKLPEALWRQLKEGSRLIMPMGKEGQTQRLVRIRKVAGRQVTEDITGVIFVPLTGAIRKELR